MTTKIYPTFYISCVVLIVCYLHFYFCLLIFIRSHFTYSMLTGNVCNAGAMRKEILYVKSATRYVIFFSRVHSTDKLFFFFFFGSVGPALVQCNKYLSSVISPNLDIRFSFLSILFTNFILG